MALNPPSQLTVISVNEPAVCETLKGTDGKVSIDRLELAVEPLILIADTIIA